MKKLIFAYLILFPWSFAWADTLTSRAALTIPTTTQADVWGAKINNNFNTIDSSAAFTGINATNDFRGTNYFANVNLYNPGRDDYSSIFSNGNSSRSQMVLYSPDDGVGINTLTELNSLQGYVDLAVKGGNALDGNPAGGRFVVLGSSADASVAYSGFRSSSPINTSTIWSLPRQDGSSGQVLSTDGSSHLSFISGGSINSGITSTQVAFSSSGYLTGNADITANGGACGGGGGTSLNIGSTITDKFSVAATGNCTGATITKSGSPQLTLIGTGSKTGAIGLNGTSNSIVSGAKAGDVVITNTQDESFILSSNIGSSSNNLLRINSSSATFSNTTIVNVTTMTVSSITFTGAVRFSTISFSPTTVGMLGTTTNDSSNIGIVGESSTSLRTTALNSPGTNQYFDIGTITLTAGDWSISSLGCCSNNGATATTCESGISTTSGNSSSGLTLGDNYSQGYPATTLIDNCLSIPMYRVSISGTTQYYLKARMAFSAGTPQAYGRITARRMR